MKRRHRRPGRGQKDHLQRLANAEKRRALSEEFGAVFPRGRTSRLPLQIESAWLDYVLEFERQSAGSGLISLRQFVGSPDLPAPGEIPEWRIEGELTRLLAILAENQVIVEFPDDMEPAGAYRLIVEELFDEMIENIRIPGLRLHMVCDEVGDDELFGRDLLQ